MKFSSLPLNSISATSVFLTWNILATQAQIDSGLFGRRVKPSSCSIPHISQACLKERASDKVTNVPLCFVRSSNLGGSVDLAARCRTFPRSKTPSMRIKLILQQ